MNVATLGSREVPYRPLSPDMVAGSVAEKHLDENEKEAISFDVDAHEANRADITMRESCPSVHSHAREAPADLDDPSDTSPNLNQLLVHLPEELIVFLLSHLAKRDCLSCACVSRTLNRIAIPSLLARCGVKNPAYRCDLVLDPFYRTRIDPLLVLQHSVFIKEIRHLSFHFTRFYPSSKLPPPLLRCLHLLRTLTHVEEVALHFPSFSYNYIVPENGALDSEHENHIKETVPICEDLLNQIVLKSSKTIRFLGSVGLLSHVYDFRKESPSSGGPLKSPARLLTGVKDYFDRRQSKKNPKNPVVLDDLRYSRSTLKGSRLFLQCSPEALKQTQLTHLHVGTVDFLRPPFSQWIFPMLQASNIHTLSFPCSHRPEDTEEVEFILQRLATAIPNLNRLYLYGVKKEKEVILTIMKWINMFAHIQTLVVEPSIDASNELAGLFHTSNSTPSDSSNTQTTPNITPSTPFSFAPHLRRIDAPYQFLTYFASIASSPSSPLPKVDHQALNGPKPRFPALEMVWLFYYCVQYIKFDPHVLANALRRIRPVLLPPRLTSDSSNSSSASLIVQIKFDRNFLGLATASTMNNTNACGAESKPQNRQSSAIDSTDTNNDPGSDAGDPNSSSSDKVDDILSDILELSKIDYLRIRLPGNRKQILQGEFDDKVLLVLSHFGGVRTLRLASKKLASSMPPEPLSPSHSMVFKEGRPELTRVEVSGS